MNKKQVHTVMYGINIGVGAIFIIGLMLLAVDKFFGVQVFSMSEPSAKVSIPVILSIATIIVAIHIALIQQSQLTKLEDVGKQTGETIEKLKTDSLINEIVNNFFILTDKEKGRQKKYKCIFPVEYRSKPLPFINQGDFYAIHVLSSRLGEDNLDLKRITQNDTIEDSLLKGNVIFICAPIANPALRRLFDTEKIKGEEDRQRLKKWPLEGLGIPCWFVEDYRGAKKERPVRMIKISHEQINELLPSPAEDRYEEADMLEGEKYEPEDIILRDHGIFARITKDNNQYIIIAGIHQYGTWIIADLLNDILSGKTVDYKSTFRESKEDFISIITGEFDNEKLTVNEKSIGVYNSYLWTKKDDTWTRVYRTGQEK